MRFDRKIAHFTFYHIFDKNATVFLFFVQKDE